MNTECVRVSFVVFSINCIACVPNELNNGSALSPGFADANVQEIQNNDMASGDFFADSGVGAKDNFVSSENKTAETYSPFFDECPTGGECNKIYWFPSVCLKSNEPEKTGYKSICTVPCELTQFGMRIYSGDQVVDTDCESWLKNSVGINCCGLVKNPFTQEWGHYCLPIVDGESCCYNSVSCLGECCLDGVFECSECGCVVDGGVCSSKCVQPKPIECDQECCPDNYDCVCEENGGFCLPGGAEMCDCDDKSWCEPLQECIKDTGCYQAGKICKPLGAEDCPEDEKCYCNPGYICTHGLPSCCPSDTPVPCGDYCCPDKNECLMEIQDCLPPGWDYCEKWGTKCGVGLDCKEQEQGCKNDNEKECGYGNIICSATEICVGEGQGVNGCCPSGQEVPCNGYCCPVGTHCEAGCGGCVVDGYKCCEDGQTECLNEQICWKGGAPCLAGGSQDCGSYWCGPEYVCSTGPQQCCAGKTPQTCGSKCCKLTDSCINEICIPIDGEYCADAPNNYCGSGYLCGKDWTQPCCCGNQCMPPGGVCCDANSGLVCVVGTECCQIENTAQGTLSACVEQGGSCCLAQNGSNVSLQVCEAVKECCSIPGYLGTKMTHCKPAGGICFFAPDSWALCSCPKDFKQCGWHCIWADDSCCSFDTDYYCPVPNKCKKIWGTPVCIMDGIPVGGLTKTEDLLGIDCSSE